VERRPAATLREAPEAAALLASATRLRFFTAASAVVLSSLGFLFSCLPGEILINMSPEAGSALA
jgi:hypothetical protein